MPPSEIAPSKQAWMDALAGAGRAMEAHDMTAFEGASGQFLQLLAEWVREGQP